MTLEQLEQLAGDARNLANKLFRNEPDSPCRCRRTGEGASCLMIEEERPLTAKERKAGWARRPYWAYDTNNLCSACEAYFHAERAAQILQRLTYWATIARRISS